MKSINRASLIFQKLKGFRKRLPGLNSGSAQEDIISAEFSASEQELPAEDHLRTLGTFGGVFTPSFLTIIGVIMYLRFSWIIANAGLFHTLIIVILANCITFITALSVSSIGSNERMETGGAYYMINRVLGFLPGGAIGIPLYISQALSIALYIIGFSETLSGIFPGMDIRITALITLTILSLLGLVGARFMVKIQYFILSLILLSLVSIAAGFTAFSMQSAVLLPAYSSDTGFWRVFAVFFPAVTGILSGVSMSGDLKDPARSIPRGTMGAVAAGFVIYLAVPVMLAFSVGRQDLFSSEALTNASRWPLFVVLGIFGATLSSAIGSIMAAPRTLQALGRDKVLPGFLGFGVGKTGEPLPALLISVVIAMAAIFAGSLNAVAEVLTMFFLTTYGVLNLSAGMERLVGNPSFRPSIKIPWWISFLGAAGCFGVMFLINLAATVVALILVAAIFFLLSLRASKVEPGNQGVWEGFWTGMFFTVSHMLEKTRSHSGKNWRPIIQVFASEVSAHSGMISLGSLITKRSGALALYAILQQVDAHQKEEVRHELESFSGTLNQRNIFTTMVETPSIFTGILVASQAAAFAGSSYNTVMIGLPTAASRQDREYTAMLTGLCALEKNVLLFKRGDIAWNLSSDPILVWWGGQEQNVRLMLFLAHLIQTNSPHGNQIRLVTIVQSEDERPAAEEKLRATLKELRIPGEVSVVTGSEHTEIKDTIAEHSRQVSLVMLGMAKPSEEKSGTYLPALRSTGENLGNTLFVLSNIPEQEYE